MRRAMMGRVLASREMLIIAALWLPAATALAAEAISGEDAAYIDWAANNCAVKSTDKQHAMVEAANAHGRDAFLKGYMRLFDGTTLSDAAATLQKKDALCASIRAWYGPAGDRIAGLIKWDRSPAAAEEKPSAKGGGGKKGGGGGRRSKQGAGAGPPQ